MRVNPVLRNESKIAVRSIKFTMMIFIYISVLSVAVMIYYASINSEVFLNGLHLESAYTFYVVMATAQAILLFFIVPALTATAICSEREKQTLDILLSSKLTPFEIIIGKISASSLKVIILIVSTMPLYAIGALIGGIKLSNILELISFFIINTIFVSTIGVFVSTYIKTSKLSTTLTYGLVLFIYIGIVAIAFAIFSFQLYKMKATVLVSIRNIVKISPIIYISPIIGFISLLSNQMGLNGDVNYIFSQYGISMYSEYISISIQLVLTIILIYLSSIKLNPLKRKNKYKLRKVKE